MNFDPTLTFGAVMIIISQIGSMFWFAARLDKRIDILSLHVTNLSNRVDAQGSDIKEHAKIGERFVSLEGRATNHASLLTTLQRDISDLRHGNGFIQNRSQGGIDGEYP